MTNPTLIAQDTPWAGFTLDSIVEALLAMRGLTNDSTTGRTVAITAEDTDAKRYIRGAINDLNDNFPSAYSTRFYTLASWTADDHSIALPSNVSAVLSVTYDGYPLAPISRDDYYRLLRTDEEGGGLEGEGTGRPSRYRIMGFSDEDAGMGAGDVDYRLVLRLFPTPTDDKELVVEYVALAPAFANDEDALPMTHTMQRWVLYRAAETWAGERGDVALLQTAERERQKVEQTLYSWFTTSRVHSSRATTRRPNVTRTRDRFRRTKR